MRRRDILRDAAALGAAGGVGLLAGCTGGGDDSAEESASLSVTDFDYAEGDSGNLVVSVTVENAGETEESGTLYVTVTAARPEGDTATETGDATTADRESLEVTVAAGGTEQYEIPFEFAVEQYERDGSIEVDLRQ